MIFATGLSLGLLAVVSYNPSWEQQAQRLRRSLAAPSHFAGFVNQSELVDWYLAADILVLPSRQAGETSVWWPMKLYRLVVGLLW